MCSELTPRARIPDTRIPQLMHYAALLLCDNVPIFLSDSIKTLCAPFIFVANLQVSSVANMKCDCLFVSRLKWLFDIAIWWKMHCMACPQSELWLQKPVVAFQSSQERQLLSDLIPPQSVDSMWLILRPLFWPDQRTKAHFLVIIYSKRVPGQPGV